jgi:hypothetical protein
VCPIELSCKSLSPDKGYLVAKRSQVLWLLSPELPRKWTSLHWPNFSLETIRSLLNQTSPGWVNLLNLNYIHLLLKIWYLFFYILVIHMLDQLKRTITTLFWTRRCWKVKTDSASVAGWLAVHLFSSILMRRFDIWSVQLVASIPLTAITYQVTLAVLPRLYCSPIQISSPTEPWLDGWPYTCSAEKLKVIIRPCWWAYALW